MILFKVLKPFKISKLNYCKLVSSAPCRAKEEKETKSAVQATAPETTLFVSKKHPSSNESLQFVDSPFPLAKRFIVMLVIRTPAVC